MYLKHRSNNNENKIFLRKTIWESEKILICIGKTAGKKFLRQIIGTLLVLCKHGGYFNKVKVKLRAQKAKRNVECCAKI